MEFSTPMDVLDELLMDHDSAVRQIIVLDANTVNLSQETTKNAMNNRLSKAFKQLMTILVSEGVKRMYKEYRLQKWLEVQELGRCISQATRQFPNGSEGNIIIVQDAVDSSSSDEVFQPDLQPHEEMDFENVDEDEMWDEDDSEEGYLLRTSTTEDLSEELDRMAEEQPQDVDVGVVGPRINMDIEMGDQGVGHLLFDQAAQSWSAAHCEFYRRD